MSATSTDAHRFMTLFRGRGDAVGNWRGPGSGRKLGPLTAAHFDRHLFELGEDNWIGVYPHLGSNGVTWGCIDIDGKDFAVEFEHEDGVDVEHDWPTMWKLANTLASILAVKGVYGHLERTANGIHLWVFPETGRAPAADMRRTLMAACKVAGYDPKEVNPKQEELPGNMLGNYVRLPYYGYYARANGVDGQPDRYFTVGGHITSGEVDGRLPLESFLDQVKLTSLDALHETGKLWSPPERVTVDGPPPEDVAAVLGAVGPLAWTVWKDGPLAGRDRSNTLAKLAYTLQADGIAAPAAFAVVKDADRRWGKFADRPDCDEQIMRFIERAYSQ